MVEEIRTPGGRCCRCSGCGSTITIWVNYRNDGRPGEDTDLIKKSPSGRLMRDAWGYSPVSDEELADWEATHNSEFGCQDYEPEDDD